MIAKYSTIPDKYWKHPFWWRLYPAVMILFLPLMIVAACFLDGYRNVFDGTARRDIKEVFLVAFGRWETREQAMKRKGWSR